MTEPCHCSPAQKTLGDHGRWCPVAIEERVKAAVQVDAKLAQMSVDYRAGYEHGIRDYVRGDFDFPDPSDPDAPSSTAKGDEA